MQVFKDIIQGSPEWRLLRKARPTASSFSEIVTPTGRPSTSAKGYARELIAEAFVPDYEYFSGNRYTEQGKLLEPDARALFEKEMDTKLEQVGFCLSDDGVCGASPDSLIRSKITGEYIAGLEVKCPAPKTHVDWVLDGVLPSSHAAQVHGSMVVTGIRNWWFMSYYPGLKPLIIHCAWGEYTDKIQTAVSDFVTYYKSAMADAIPKLQIK